MTLARRGRPPSRGTRVIKFIETYCRVPEGTLVGQPLVLLPFQKKFIKAVYDGDVPVRRAILTMGRKNGKGLALDTPIPTPNGWTTMGALAPGDVVFSETGEPCRVSYVSPVHVGLRCWRLTFSDGTSIVADEQHKWLTTRRRSRKPKVVTTPEIADSVFASRNDGVVEYAHGIAVAGALNTPDTLLPLDPYLLGCWLGDGSSSSAQLHCGDQDVEYFHAAVGSSLGCAPIRRRERTAWVVGLTDGRGGTRETKVVSVLRRLGVLGDKHVPQTYLWAGTEQRRALLQGLMDTDGTVTRTGRTGAVSCVFSNTNPRLVDGVVQLARSLGLKVGRRERDAKLHGRVVGRVHEAQFTAWAEDKVFRLPRKLDRLKARPPRPTRASTLKIVACEPVPSVPTKCIQVDSPSSLFLAGEGMTPTHNTALIACLLLTHLIGPEARRNSQIVSGALSRDQAALVFHLAAKMVQLSPELAKVVKVIPSGKRLVGLPLNVEYRALAADGTTAMGLSPVVVILDEVGQVQGPQSDFVDALLTSQGAHTNPLVVTISTQAANDADLLSVWIDDAKTSSDPAIVCHLYTAPAGCALDDPRAWAAANPALGVFRSKEDLAAQALLAGRMPTSESSFRNLMLNQRVAVNNPFVSRSVWLKNSGEYDESVFSSHPTYLGIDLSSRADLTAIVMVAQSDSGEWCVHTTCFTPESGLLERAKRDRAPYDTWVREGHLLTTPGASVDYDWVAEWLLARIQGGQIEFKLAAYDRWRMDVLLAAMRRQGADDHLLAKFVPFGQGTKDMSPALDTLEAELLNGRLRHGGHPVLTMCAANALVWRDSSGNRKFVKDKATGRIDAMVALAMALGIGASQKVDDEFTVEVW
jgi:phage terminase large subunit-like protein